MTTSQLLEQLTTAHEDFARAAEALSPADFTATPPGKWNAGQQVDHIIRSVQPVAGALALPALASGQLFGVADRPSLSHEELIGRYQQELAGGVKASGKFVPGEVGAEQQTTLGPTLRAAVAQLVGQAGQYSEEQLDTLLMPHPVLGQLTLREMLYFTLSHARHHHRLMLVNLGQAQPA